MVTYFNHSEGINQYYAGNFELALARLRQALPSLVQGQDMGNEMVAYFYIGKSYLKLGEAEGALPYLLKIDYALMEHDYMRRDLREAIALLVDYHAKRKNKDLVIRYSYHLRKADSILGTNFETLSGKVHERQIALLEKDNESDRKLWLSGLLSLIVCAAGTGAFFYRRHRQMLHRFQKNYEAGLEQDNAQPAAKIPEGTDESEIISGKDADVYRNILEFEQSEKYLGKGLDLKRVAKLLKTNSKHLPPILLKCRGKGIVQYINDLKCEHAHDMLTRNVDNARNYDQKSFAKLLGFGSVSRFRKTFTNRYGYSPAFYLKQLRMKEKQKGRE